MKLSFFISRSLILFLIIGQYGTIFAQEQAQSNGFVPRVGQEGKDVIWVPTPELLVNKMLEIAEVNSKDFLVDLGSGDGRTVIAAAKLGASAIGIEYNPEMVALSKKNAEKAGVSSKTEFIETDLFGYDLSKATVITMFLLPEINLRLRPKLLDLKPGTRVVSNTFTMGEWEPDYEATTDETDNSWYTALMWIVPAKVAGIWNMEQGDLNIRQEFQTFYGTLTIDKKITNITNGRLTGDSITFVLGDSKYTGRVDGKITMSGTVTTGSVTKNWKATLKSSTE
jgi:hypothetical protein